MPRSKLLNTARGDFANYISRLIQSGSSLNARSHHIDLVLSWGASGSHHVLRMCRRLLAPRDTLLQLRFGSAIGTVPSHGMCGEIWWKFTDISGEYPAQIFLAER
jgi:hypothetical protein